MGDLGELLITLIILGAVAWVKLPWVRQLIAPGRAARPAADHSVNPAPVVTLDRTPLPLVERTPTIAPTVIATPQNQHNSSIVIGPGVQRLAALVEDDPRVVDAAIMMLARLVAAKKLNQTDAIKIGLGIPPGSGSPRYDAARSALLEELDRLAGPAPAPELVGQRHDRIMNEEVTPTA